MLCWAAMKTLLRLLPLLVAPALSGAAAEVVPLVPDPVPNDEAALLAAARAAPVVTLDGGYRQADLVVARVATWDGPRDLSIRLFLPPGDHDTPRPLVAYVHGGGFIGGSPLLDLHDARSGFAAALRALLDDGFAVASLGYRLAREAGWPAPIQDTLCGLRFLARHGALWNVDARRVGICGHSAGARLAALLTMVPQDRLHTGPLPWAGEPVEFAALWLWAGAAWDGPQVDAWPEFGKPRNYSVPRLLFGEHPAWDDAARHRLRVRHNLPHLSRALPPTHLLRGASDYGGDHRDAERTVEIWRALGIAADLSIVPGGHSATGPHDRTTAFFRSHLGGPREPARGRDPLETARILTGLGEAAAALEVLNAAQTTEDGTRPPHGDWMILHDHTLVWLPDVSTWPDESQALARAAIRRLAEAESAAAPGFLERGAWFRAAEAAGNVLRLAGDDPAMRDLAEQAVTAARREAQVFRALAEANAHVHAGGVGAARARLEEFDDPRIREALDRLNAPEEAAAPPWAAASGTDLYGRWADLRLPDETSIRMRWVGPGNWGLPEHLRYRNRTEEPWVTEVAVEHGFWLAETENTVAQWKAIGGGMPDSVDAETPDLPITGIDYLQILDWLERLEARHEGVVVRLPREEEWLHAVTAGGRTDAMAGIDTHAVHALNVDAEAPGPRPVRDVLPSLGGFYGLVGGVQEWTGSPGRHTARFQDARGRFRVLAYPIARGGGWSSMPHSLGPETRQQHRHGNRQPDLGFRLALGGGPEAGRWREAVER